MRVLWITNGPIAIHREQLGISTVQGGGWMDASLNQIMNIEDIQIGLATVFSCKSLIRNEAKGIVMYALPDDRKKGIYKYNNKKNIQLWESVAVDFRPDVIHIWGTEMAHALCAMQAMKDIPAVVYLQGLMSQIYNHNDAGIHFLDILRFTTIRDFIEEKGIHKINLFEKKRAAIEKEILNVTNNVILENDWAAHNCRVLNPNCQIFRSRLPINPFFAEYSWNYDKAKRHTIFTVAGGYPIKGHHILLKALAIVKKSFPDVKLYIPGYNPLNDDKGLRHMFPHRYTNYLKYLIKKYSLADSIIYTGKLSIQEMASYMSTCNVFVMPSAIENHSSTLIEAMMVGAPCVTSYVGGVSDYLSNGVNGMLYRFEEHETLAGLILNLFNNPELASVIGKNAKKSSNRERLSINVAEDFLSVYRTIIR